MGAGLIPLHSAGVRRGPHSLVCCPNHNPDGTVSWVFLKQNWSIVTPTDVDGADAAWLAEPHEIVYVDRSGVERRETARLSGPCLVWQPLVADRRTTARLEGIAELVTARSIAESMR